MYDLKAILKCLKFPISTTFAGRSFHSRIILTKKEYFELLTVKKQCKRIFHGNE